MSGSSPEPPSGVEFNSRPMLPHMNNNANGITAAFDKAPADGNANDGTFDVHVSTGQGDEMGELPGAAEGSPPGTQDPTSTDEGDIVFKRFNDFPLEVRSAIWKAAAHNAKPFGIYHFTCKKMDLGAGPPGHSNVADTVHTHLHQMDPEHPLVSSIIDLIYCARLGRKVLTFTPSAMVANLTRDVRSLFASCSEARRELMRCPRLSSSFEFDYLKSDKCNLGTIRPFYYDTDWVCMDEPWYARSEEVAEVCRTRCTPDISRIQHFALSYPVDCRNYHLSLTPRDYSIWSRLSGLKSCGLYAPSFCIIDVPFYDERIPQEERAFLKGVPASMSGPVIGPTMSNRSRGYRHAKNDLLRIISDMFYLEIKKKKKSGASIPCEIAGLQFCILVHADSQEGLDLAHFREDGSHLKNVDMDDFGDAGKMLKILQDPSSEKEDISEWVRTIARRHTQDFRRGQPF